MPSTEYPSRIVRIQRLPQFMLFVAFVAWYFAAVVVAESAANGLAFRLRMVSGRGLLEACFQLFLLVVGFALLQAITRQALPLEALTALPRRSTAGREWLTGAALGWGMVVAALLPTILTMKLHARLSFGLAEVRDALLALGTLGVLTLGREMTFRGYPFRLLTELVGPSCAVLLMVLGAGISVWNHAWVPVVASMLLTALLSVSWLRTHAIWIAWGMHFSVAACVGVLFGLPVDREAVFSPIVRSRMYGPEGLTGGGAGPMGSLFSVAVLVAAIVVLYRLTRDYAWRYTHRPIVAGGEIVHVAPPAAHTAMEEQAVKAPALVQILPTTPTTFSVEAAGNPVHTAPLPDRLP